ncbi:prepilin-type N-terminal cleavage/methylation domain-containing protein [Pyruvatibacter mobilis]|uniref:prepilin-type N-terminal cleavage/methylation domain-containing protein n=1 Tax=Pyruvatibacter mobilis TaxID=1712261 RepID=UPI000488099E
MQRPDSSSQRGIAGSVEGDSGFTLVETLVALALTGLLLGFLYQGITWAARYLEANQRASALAEENTEILSLFHDAVTLAYPLVEPHPEVSYAVAFAGEPDAITFLTTSEQNGLIPGVKKIRFANTGQGFETIVWLYRDPSIENPPIFQRLFPDVRGEFAFRPDEAPRAWQDDWRDQRDMPGNVRISLSRGTARDWDEEMIARPIIDVDAACVFDALTRRCKGR